MSVVESVVIPKFLKVKASIKRDINSTENAQVASQINECIDKMQEYKADSYMVHSLRSKISHYRGESKIHGAKVLKDRDIYQCNSNLGTMTIYNVPSMSSRSEFVEIALKELNLSDIDTTISESAVSTRQHVKINTDALKLIPSVTSRIDELADVFHKFTEQTITETDSPTDKFICSALSWIRDNMPNHRLYLKNYALARDLFIKHSKHGLFPRAYTYKGVVFIWEDIAMISNMDTKVREYLSLNNRLMYDKYLNMLNKIRADLKETRIMFSLDNFDYDSDE